MGRDAGRNTKLAGGPIVEIETYLINLDDATQRRRHFETQARQAGIEFNRVPAFDGRNMRPAHLPGYDDRIARRVYGRSLTGAEIGVYLSHLECARRFLATGKPFGLVFEDDITFDETLPDLLEKFDTWARTGNEQFDLVHLSPERRKYYEKTYMIDTVHEICVSYYLPMTAGAILWSRSGARKLVTEHAEIRMPVDVTLRDHYSRAGRALFVWPPVARQGAFMSSIDEPGGKRTRNGRSWNYPLVQWRLKTRHKVRALARLAKERT